jgi:ABC-type sugar transport system permease subunit
MRGIKAFFTVLFVMPLGHAVTVVALKGALGVQIGAAVFAVVLACILIYATKYIKSPAWATFAGMIAGVLVWAGTVEIGVKLGAEAIELGEQRAMEFTLAIIIPPRTLPSFQ